MDPFLWAYGYMAQELGAGDGRKRRDPGRLLRYREALGLTPVEVRSLRSTRAISDGDTGSADPEEAWREDRPPDISLADRTGLLRTLATAARGMPDGWHEERRRLVRLGERLEISADDVEHILGDGQGAAVATPVGFETAPAPETHRPPGIAGRKPSRRALILAGVVSAGGLASIALGRRILERRSQRARFEGFEERFGPTLVFLQLECEFLLGTGRVAYQSRGLGFFVREDGLFVTAKHVVQPWKFVPELVRKLESGYELDEDSVRLLAWRKDDLRLAGGGRFDESAAGDTRNNTLELVRTTPDVREQRAVALPEGGLHRGEYHVLDAGDVALLRARVDQPVPFIEFVPAGIEITGQRVLALGMEAPNRISRVGGGQAVGSAGRLYQREDGVIKLTASVPSHQSGGPVLGADGLAFGIAADRLGDPRGPRCVPARAITELVGA